MNKAASYCDDCARVELFQKDGAPLQPERRCVGCEKPMRRGPDHRVYFGTVGPFCCTACRDRHYGLQPTRTS